MDSRKKPFFPKGAVRLIPGQRFCFDCHPGVPCFTECCRMLELELSPYDVLRLRLATGLTSQQLHDRYIIMEHAESSIFPKYYLTMVDDGRASCAFVTAKGCSVYAHRPGACRAYPLGRAAVRNRQGSLQEHHVLLQEEHCLGFAEPKTQDAQSYTKDQGLDLYNVFNDAVASLIQHESIMQGKFRPDRRQLELFHLVLYNIDSFRAELNRDDGRFPSCPEGILNDDEELLGFGISLLKDTFFQET